MMTKYFAAAAVLLAATFASTAAEAQDKSRSERFFVGVGLEGNGVVVEDSDTESGGGIGLVVGYGFTRHLAVFGQLSGASIESADGMGSYGLGHFDLGLRAHFRAPTKTVVPFVQFGVSGRGMQQDLLGDEIEASGAGGMFGAGLNAHFTPAVAFSAAAVWTVGNFSDFKVNGTSLPVDSFGVTTARVHVGIVWFPQSPR
jgi:hypothetical protein